MGAVPLLASPNCMFRQARSLFTRRPMPTYNGPTLPTAEAAQLASSSSEETAYFANGCFWGTEHMYRKVFKDKLNDVKVGYTGGEAENPNYRQVCTGSTNHAEAIKVLFDPAIFTTSDAQAEIAKKVRDEVQKEHYPDQKIATTIEPVGKWWDAEDYHQEYLTNNPSGYECPSHLLH